MQNYKLQQGLSHMIRNKTDILLSPILEYINPIMVHLTQGYEPIMRRLVVLIT